ncbi:glycoside hydrolase family 38 N-terminal domain-containing protein [Mucisphaera calidilacus]|uniref:Mannosylglycerate hydrolase n=1 Tax=Mucisphaera calidilacus TaxID=2527982 RepID=A0A518BWS5_9BACT|nr:glycoside hydrolase family 38 C-terminal domain-containing protein [Mucisphaera calidilacus]QDU71425.1 Mannosylglycerate hydrolase [Mucisphaera calidilacus]
MSTTQTPPSEMTKTQTAATRQAHYVLSTHWDREWYQPFQLYRYRLVQLLDRILDGFANGTLRGPFQTDGQAIILDDYLEIRPERRNEIQTLAREGKLVIGPWYVLPDEFLVSGESMIRNIALGRQIARDYGTTPSAAGFVCDLFGHVSQLPQMLAGFGVKGGYVWRGTNNTDTRHLIWEGADGTELPCYRFGQRGYCSYASAVRGASDFDECATPEQLDQRLKDFLDDEAAKSPVDALLLFDGGDHMEWDRAAYAALTKRMDQPIEGYEILHTSLDAYIQAMAEQADRITQRVHGELREPGKEPMATCEQWVIPGVASSRVWIKLANAHCQTLLTRWAEPLSALSTQLLGTTGDKGFLDVAWKWLLKNHPHDSIGGCSVDRVHEDMKFRFSQCEQIGNELTSRAIQRITASVEGDIAEDQVRIGIFNPTSRPLNGPVKFDIEVPVAWPRFNEWFFFEQKPAMRLYDPNGNEVAYERLAQDMDRRRTRLTPTSFPAERQVNVITVVADLDIPASGYTTLTAKRGEEHRHTRFPMVPGLVTSDRSMENQHLAVTVETGGLLTLTDKRTGRTYEQLLAFEDAADIGDGWYHGQPLSDQTYSSAAGAADVAVVASSPSYAALRVRTSMRLPAEFDFKRMRRVEQFETLEIDSLVVMFKDSDHLKITTTVNNTVKDHRLRVLLPTGCTSATTYLADTAFDVVERDIALREDNHLYRELEIETRPQQSWTAVNDARGGLAVVTVGLLETAVRDVPERPIALTLLRSTRRTVLTDGEPEGQIPGPVTLTYAIAPLPATVNRKRLFDIAEDLNTGQRVCTVMHDDRPHLLDGMPEPKLPATSGLVQIDGPAVLTAARRLDDKLELRLFNPEETPVDTTIKLDPAWKQATPVDFEGNPADKPVSLADGQARVTLERKKILTLHLEG